MIIRSNTSSLKICYVLLHIPVPSETFIITEIIALQSVGVDVYTVSLGPSQMCHEELMACINHPIYNLSDNYARLKYKESPLYPAACKLALSYNIAPSLAAQAAVTAEYISTYGIQHIHAHFATEAALVALLVAKLTGITYSFTAHAYDIFMLNIAGETNPERRLKLLIEHAAKFITVSEYNKKHFLDLTETCADKLEIVHYGMNFKRFNKFERKSTDMPTFLSVGRLVEKKGHEFLLRSFKNVVDSCDARLRIVGEGELRSALTALAHKLGIAEKVTFLGAVSSNVVLNEMQSADVFVLHSLTAKDGNKEGMPVSIMEACATGLPVISTRHAGIPELIIEDVSGFLVEEKDWQGFAEAMLTLAISPELRVKMGQAGHSIVMENFNILHEAKKLKDIFTAIIEGSATTPTKIVDTPRIKILACYNCHSEKRAFYAAENGYSLVKCANCGLLYLEERPDDNEISQAHKQGKHTGLKELDVTGFFVDSKVSNYLKILNDIFNGNLGDKKKWLDIGCGHGEFIAALLKYSSGAFIVTGSEPNIHKQESARGRGLNVGYSDMESHVEKYDVISLLNVYSHLPNPPEFLKSLKKNLNQNGEILIETGDTADLSASHHYRPFYLPDHLSFASEKIVTNILMRLGFEIVSVTKYPYPNCPQLLINPTCIAKEIVKAVMPNHKSRLQEYFNNYLNRKRWAKTDMYIRARLKS